MKMRFLSAVLLLALVLAAFSGCGTVSDIAGNVADAAMEELKVQIADAIEENKVELVEMKSAFGKLNDDGGSLQFFCAMLIRADSADLAAAALDGNIGSFDDFGVVVQTGSAIENEHLVNKSLSYDHTDFSDGNYYTVFLYASSFALEDLTSYTFATSGS